MTAKERAERVWDRIVKFGETGDDMASGVDSRRDRTCDKGND